MIDDNAVFRENLSEIFEMQGYNVITASNGMLGLEIIKNQNPDLVVCDINMPVLDGEGVLNAIASAPDKKRPPFIFLTARFDDVAMRSLFEKHSDSYITKPFDANNLLQLVQGKLAEA